MPHRPRSTAGAVWCRRRSCCSPGRATPSAAAWPAAYVVGRRQRLVKCVVPLDGHRPAQEQPCQVPSDHWQRTNRHKHRSACRYDTYPLPSCQRGGATHLLTGDTHAGTQRKTAPIASKSHLSLCLNMAATSAPGSLATEKITQMKKLPDQEKWVCPPAAMPMSRINARDASPIPKPATTAATQPAAMLLSI